MICVSLKGGVSKLSGHVAAVEQSTYRIAEALPRVPAELRIALYRRRDGPQASAAVPQDNSNEPQVRPGPFRLSGRVGGGGALCKLFSLSTSSIHNTT
jgi:hypothetical protein